MKKLTETQDRAFKAMNAYADKHGPFLKVWTRWGWVDTDAVLFGKTVWFGRRVTGDEVAAEILTWLEGD